MAAEIDRRPMLSRSVSGDVNEQTCRATPAYVRLENTAALNGQDVVSKHKPTAQARSWATEDT